jgi:hypothetical protein
MKPRTSVWVKAAKISLILIIIQALVRAALVGGSGDHRTATFFGAFVGMFLDPLLFVLLLLAAAGLLRLSQSPPPAGGSSNDNTS